MAFEPTPLRLALAALLLLLTTIFLRILAILPSRRPPAPPRTSPAHILIVLGSGGHTAEMLSMIRHLSPERYIYRTYLVSSGDAFSTLKAIDFERGLTGVETTMVVDGKETGVVRGEGFEILTVPRARRIHQPLWTAPFTSLLCLLSCLRFLSPTHRRPRLPTNSGGHKTYTPTTPDLILTNGPATGVLVLIATFILRFFGVINPQKGARCVYVESWARVGGLSLSGRIVEGLGLVERFLVQWEKGLGGDGEGEEEDVVEGGEVVGKRKGGREWRGFLVE
ncbi:UDP-N-acetylglucosamine transferase subunit [Pseudogymnoascus verrucosus]|uniref:UDP-N-acetylglucosamine transferase subunit ALG14 n=1 Tax=Pseudogymnoascus verrucosus TaxID=342668 RepID=A0A1B8GLT8_9PEZI|nr:UDP-N-acetylglucosamine transferase subunit [Pseudogymnoascus verrucosus]OBT96800.1 UDP-N-acetylglucosamine transferase subunit [Pseudogymnoascus verrucosus]